MSWTGQPIRILQVDSNCLVRVGLRMLLDSWQEIQVVGDTGDEREAVAVAQREAPHVILLELDFKSGVATGLDLISKLQTASKARIIVVTQLHAAELHHSAIERGARGLVLKEHSPEQLRNAILKVHAGEVWLDDKVITSLVTIVARSSRRRADAVDDSTGLAKLSPRESQLAHLAGEGLSNKEIARRLFISETTVRHHLTSIFRKLGVVNRLELIIHLLRPETGSEPSRPDTARNAPRPLSEGTFHKDEPRQAFLKHAARRRTV